MTVIITVDNVLLEHILKVVLFLVLELKTFELVITCKKESNN